MNNDTEFRDRVYLNLELKEMFFSLDLIESYGSGIRRAKNAMKENGSPELVFEPSNDTDDYTMVTAYINEEFARIQTEESKKNNRQEKSDDIESAIIEQLLLEPKITRKKLAEVLSVGEQTIRYRLEKLQREGRIYRKGSTKSGEWVVTNKSCN